MMAVAIQQIRCNVQIRRRPVPGEKPFLFSVEPALSKEIAAVSCCLFFLGDHSHTSYRISKGQSCIAAKNACRLFWREVVLIAILIYFI